MNANGILIIIKQLGTSNVLFFYYCRTDVYIFLKGWRVFSNLKWMDKFWLKLISDCSKNSSFFNIEHIYGIVMFKYLCWFWFLGSECDCRELEAMNLEIEFSCIVYYQHNNVWWFEIFNTYNFNAQSLWSVFDKWHCGSLKAILIFSKEVLICHY